MNASSKLLSSMENKPRIFSNRHQRTLHRNLAYLIQFDPNASQHLPVWIFLPYAYRVVFIL